MASSTSDFAHPIAKTVACYLLVLAFPAVFVAHTKGIHVPSGVWFLSTMLSLAGVGGLLGRPSTIIEAIRAICTTIVKLRGS